MHRTSGVADRVIERDGVRLAVQDDGEGQPVVLLHGLTATRRYVVMGSKALGALRVTGSSPTTLAATAIRRRRLTDGYTYRDLGRDLEAVLDDSAWSEAVLAGASMGAHTLLWLALNAPARVAGLVVITPAYEPRRSLDARAARALGRAGRWASARRASRASSGLRGAEGPGAHARDGVERDPPAAVAARASRRGGGRIERGAALATVRRAGGAQRDRRADGRGRQCDEADPEHPQAVGRSTRRRSPELGWSSMSRDVRRSPGRGASCRG